MRLSVRTLICAATILALPACEASDNDPGPGGVTVGEAKALDEAAQMLEARRLPPEALKGEQPELREKPAPSVP